MMTPRDAFTELLGQHARLRDLIERCELYADELDAGRMPPAHVVGAVGELRVAFDAHNAYEEKLLRPILRDAGVVVDLRADDLVATHVGEHRTMRDELGGGVTGELRATLDRLRVHLATEERMWMGLHSGSSVLGPRSSG